MGLFAFPEQYEMDKDKRSTSYSATALHFTTWRGFEDGDLLWSTETCTIKESFLMASKRAYGCTLGLHRGNESAFVEFDGTLGNQV